MLVLIHGLGGAPQELEGFRRSLDGEMRSWSPTLLSHGGRPLHHQPGFEPIIEDLIAQMDRQEAWPAILFGYSFGGYIALYLASRYPDRVRAVVTLGTRVIHDKDAMSFLRYIISPERIGQISPEKRALLEGSHGGPEIFRQRMIRARALFERLYSDPPLNEDDLRLFDKPVLLMCGDSDQFVPMKETERLATLLPNARISSFAGSLHPLEPASLGLMSMKVQDFLREIDREGVGQATSSGGKGRVSVRETEMNRTH